MTTPLERPDLYAGFPNVGRWAVTQFPPGWLFVVGFGIRQMVADPRQIPANVGLGQDMLVAPETLEQYIGRQAKLIREYLSEVKLAGPQLTAFHGAEEGFLLIARHTPPGRDSMLQAQTYVRAGAWVGIVTLTTPENRLKATRADYDAFSKGLRIRPPDPPEETFSETPAAPQAL